MTLEACYAGCCDYGGDVIAQVKKAGFDPSKLRKIYVSTCNNYVEVEFEDGTKAKLKLEDD